MVNIEEKERCLYMNVEGFGFGDSGWNVTCLIESRFLVYLGCLPSLGRKTSSDGRWQPRLFLISLEPAAITPALNKRPL